MWKRHKIAKTIIANLSLQESNQKVHTGHDDVVGEKIESSISAAVDVETAAMMGDSDKEGQMTTTLGDADSISNASSDNGVNNTMWTADPLITAMTAVSDCRCGSRWVHGPAMTTLGSQDPVKEKFSNSFICHS